MGQFTARVAVTPNKARPSGKKSNQKLRNLVNATVDADHSRTAANADDDVLKILSGGGH